jgi:hypothetical protein
MPTDLEFSVVAAIAADPRHRWSGLSRHAAPEAVHTPEVVDEVDDEVDDEDDESLYNFCQSRRVVAEESSEETEELEEEVEEGVDQVPPEDIAEYLALEHDEHIVPMNFVGLDIADKKTSAGKEGDAVSTQRVYKRINSKYSLFLAELEDSDLDLCADIYLPGKADFVNRKLVRQFIQWYISHTSPTTSHIAESLMFLQRKLSDAMNAVGEIPRKGMIREDTWIKDFSKDMLVKVANSEEMQLRDLHADMDRQITRTDQLRLVDSCYNSFVMTNLSATAKSNVVTGYTLSSQIGSRGSDSRGIMISHGFVKVMRFLGEGEDVDHFVHNHGKTNRVGRVTYKAFATHRNPRLDSSAHLGMSTLLRFACYGEPFPNFLNPKDYTKRPVFRAASSYLKSYPASTQYSNWKKVFAHCGIFCSKVTHVCRGQIQQELSDRGVCAQDSERFFGYAASGEKKMNSNQKDSYLFTPPVAPVCGAADGDPKNPSFHKPAWSIKLGESELLDLCPWLYSELHRVDAAFVANPTFKARKKLCLIQARACLLALERRIAQAVKMLASVPVDDHNNLICESSPIHVRWASHPVLKLPFFKSPIFLDICHRVRKAQMTEALMLDDEPSAQQKHWITHEIGDKVVPKLHACIRANQSIMQGQRHQLDEAVLLGQRIWSIEHKLESILHHLRCPANLSNDSKGAMEDPCSDDDSVMEPVTPTKSCSPSFVSTAPAVAALSAPTDWFKLSFDPAKNSKGFLRKKAPPQKVINRPFSSSNITALDYWNEYFYGSPGKMPLKTLEETQGSSWRSDGKFKRLDGKKGTALKAGWSLQKPIYEYLEFLMLSFTEDVALSMVQDVFDLFPYKHSKKPNLAKCKKEFTCRWGPLKVTHAPSFDLNASTTLDDSIVSEDDPIASEDEPSGLV